MRIVAHATTRTNKMKHVTETDLNLVKKYLVANPITEISQMIMFDLAIGYSHLPK